MRVKTFGNLVVLWLFAKVFSVKFVSVASFGAAKASNPRKFSPSKVSHYTVTIFRVNPNTEFIGPT